MTGNTGPQNTVQVFPNPIRDQFYIYVRNFTSPNLTINLYNSIGQLVYSKKVTLVNGSDYMEIPAKHLPAGEYNLQLSSGNDFKYLKKLIK
jgi:hypothetical protein